ncbi:MAG: sulfotransferase domain-containing protein [Pseudomonadota bacterium]
MQLPALYICFGMAKSGSTLAFQITREVARQAGHAPAPDGEFLDAQGSHTNFVSNWRDIDLQAMVAAARGRGRMMVLKTHGRPPDGMADAVTKGDIAVQAVCRDPRDIALSMIDMGRQGGDWGVVNGVPIGSPEDAQRRIGNHVVRFRAWAAMPGALTLNYERVAFDIEGTATKIARHLDIDVSAREAVARIERRNTHLNKGLAQRHRSEMTAEQSAEWHRRFQDFIVEHCSDLPEGCLDAAPRRGPGALWRRVLGR